MPQQDATKLLNFIDKTHKRLIEERDCFYEGCSDANGNIPLDEDRDTLKAIDADIDEAQATLALCRSLMMFRRADLSPERPFGTLGDDRGSKFSDAEPSICDEIYGGSK